MPLLIVEHGRPLVDRMGKARVDEDDVIVAARGTHGLERLDRVGYAVLDRDGAITIIPESGR